MSLIILIMFLHLCAIIRNVYACNAAVLPQEIQFCRLSRFHRCQTYWRRFGNQFLAL